MRHVIWPARRKQEPAPSTRIVPPRLFGKTIPSIVRKHRWLVRSARAPSSSLKGQPSTKTSLWDRAVSRDDRKFQIRERTSRAEYKRDSRNKARDPDGIWSFL